MRYISCQHCKNQFKIQNAFEMLAAKDIMLYQIHMLKNKTVTKENIILNIAMNIVYKMAIDFTLFMFCLAIRVIFLIIYSSKLKSNLFLKIWD